MNAAIHSLRAASTGPAVRAGAPPALEQQSPKWRVVLAAPYYGTDEIEAVADVLRDALAPLAAKIQLAFIFGSVAQGKEGATSDVDVLVVGSVSFAAVVEAVGAASERWQCPIRCDPRHVAQKGCPPSCVTRRLAGRA